MVRESQQDRRQFLRASNILTIQHRLLKRKGKAVDAHWHFSMTEDMSAGGLRFCSAIPYRIGDLLEISVCMSGVLNVFNGLGKVIRIESIKKSPSYRVAVYFTSLRKKSSSK